MARRGKYGQWLTPDGLLMIKGWARDGLSEEQISKNMGIAYSTFNVWKDRFPELSEAIKSGKAPVDIEVENALLKAALGYTVKVKKPIKVKEEKQKSGVGKIVTEKIEYMEEEVYIPGNTVAQIFWLKNRKPNRWRDRQVVEADTTALEKLDAILRETRNNARADAKLEYLNEDDIQQEAE